MKVLPESVARSFMFAASMLLITSCFDVADPADSERPPIVRASFYLEDPTPPSSLDHQLLVYFKAAAGE